MKRVCVLPGDGIGPEVVGCAVRVLEEVTDELELEHGDIGQAAKAKHGSYLPEDTMELMRRSDSCLFGAVTSSFESEYTSPVLTFRRALGLYANVRPVKTLVRMPHVKDVDLIIVRENSEGLYTGEEVLDDAGVTTLRRVSRAASEKIIRFSIKTALEQRRRRVCCVHKSNVLKASDGLFVKVFRELMTQEGGGLVAEEQLVDSAAMKLVVEPSGFDVLVTLNLYGDILSDVAAGAAGGLGFAPSGNIGERHSVFEPAHGSAPDIAGKGIANPTAAILSAAMMLKHLGLADEGLEVERAVAEAYAGGHMTCDMGGRLGSSGFTDFVIKNLRETER